ncbi:TPA: SIS domain-containing protein, partial [Haemophilus influenzae 10810]
EQSPEELYCHQFNAIAKSGDLLIAFAPLGTEKIVLNIISHAVSKEVNVIVLTGSNNDAIQGILADKDLEISIPATKESRILENHLFVINALCELVDQTLFPSA